MTTNMDQFEAAITQLTEPLNGQYPRPWMTDLADPLSANLFVVGRNQAKGYEASRLSHKRHLDALFNRSTESCRGVYEEMTGSRPSPTRKNIDSFRRILAKAGISRVLETNVVCYSTPMSGDLRLPLHRGGTARGTEIFLALLHFVQPKVLVAHGSGATKALAALLGTALPAPPTANVDPQFASVGEMKIFVTPSLAPPKWNQWCAWADQYLANVAKVAAREL